MLFKTKSCHKFNHPEFCVICDTQVIPHNDIKYLINFFEDEVKKGIRFKTNETIQIGWMVNQLKLMDDQYLHVLEPNLKDLPISFIDSVTNTLRHLRQQKDVVESINEDLEVSYTSIRSSIVVCPTYQKATSIYLVREKAENNFSGWFFRDLDSEDQENYRPISLYEFACHRPDLVKFMGIPPEYGMHVRPGDNFRIIFGEREIFPKPGSFLDQINRTQNYINLN